jgi:hypothetical protein
MPISGDQRTSLKTAGFPFHFSSQGIRTCQLIIVKTVNVVSIEDGAIDHIFYRFAVPKLLYRELLPSLLRPDDSGSSESAISSRNEYFVRCDKYRRCGVGR